MQSLENATFRVADIADLEAVTAFLRPIHADRLVKLGLPELELDGREPRRLEIQEIERLAGDRRVQIRPVASGDGRCVDLSVHRNRWVV